MLIVQNIILNNILPMKISDRFWEIDALRGIAIIMMVFYHITYNLYYFADFPIKIYSFPWMYFQRTTASLFLLLVGISLTISYSKKKFRYSKNDLFLINLKRGFKIFLWGLIITTFTLVFLNDGFILFGILHLIGVSIIVSFPLIENKYKNFALGLLLIVAGGYLRNFTFGTSYLLFLGFRPASFFSFDYFPIMPWYGVVLIGIFLGNIFYPNANRRFNAPNLSSKIIVKGLSFLGTHSLKIYLIHQPLIILLLYALGYINLFSF